MTVIFYDLDDVNFTTVTEDEDITAWAEIGDGQNGAYLIFLGMEFKGENKRTFLGKGAEVKGRKGLVSATITDTLQQTNRTSITVFVQEGNLPFRSFGPYKKEVPADKDTIVFTLGITFS